MVRLVKMEFNERNIEDFKIMFDNIKQKIVQSAGCKGLRLVQDENHPHVFFTISEWQTVEDLDQYRNSELFDATWNTIKKWFSAKPEAWNLNSLEQL